MSTYSISLIKGGATLEIESSKNSNKVTICIDNPLNVCVDNAYNGDHASIELSIDNVKELHGHLAKILTSKEANHA